MDTGQAVTIVVGTGSVVVAAVAAFYAASQSLATRKQASAAEQALRDNAQPYVYADLRPDDKDPQVVSLVIENTGRTVAKDVRITFDPPLESATWDDFATLPVLVNGLSALPPGRKMTWLFDIGFKLFQADTARRYHVVVTADGPFGKVEPLEYDLDLVDLTRHEARNVGTIKSVVDTLEHTNKHLSNMAQHLSVVADASAGNGEPG